MKKSISTLFNMPKSERNGAFVLLILIGILLVFRFLIPHLFKPDHSKYDDEFRSLLALLDEETETLPNPAELPGFKNQSKRKPRERTNDRFGYTVPAPLAKNPAVERMLHDFDPNKADYHELTGLGFSSRTTNALLRYREKGGKFREPSDLLTLYGIDTLFYLEIRPFIRIQKEEYSGVISI